MNACKESGRISERSSRGAHVVREKTRKAVAKEKIAKEKHLIRENKKHTSASVTEKHGSLNEIHMGRIKKKLNDVKSGDASAQEMKCAVTDSNAAAVSADAVKSETVAAVQDAVAVTAIEKPVAHKSFDMHSVEDNPVAEELPKDAVMDASPVSEAPVQSTETHDPVLQTAQVLQQPAAVPEAQPALQTESLPVQSAVKDSISGADNTEQAAVEMPAAQSVASATPAIRQDVPPVESVSPAPALPASAGVQPGAGSSDALSAEGAQDSAGPDSENADERDDINKLREQIAQLEESIQSLHQMYMDGVISKDSYDNTRENIEDNIRDDKIHISIDTQKGVLGKLKETLEGDVKKALDNKDYREETDTIKKDLDRLEKLHEYKVIDDKTYESSKAKIHDRIDRMSALIADVNSAIDRDFEKYTASFGDELKEHKESDETGESLGTDETKEEDKKEEADKEEVKETKEEDSKKTIAQKVMGLFKIGKKKKPEDETVSVSQYKEELEKISKIESKRDALIELRVFLKKEIQKRAGVNKQLTYEQLITELPKMKGDEKYKTELVSFFKETSDGEYKGVIKEEDFTGIYNRAVGFLKRIGGIKQENAAAEKDEKGKKKRGK